MFWNVLTLLANLVMVAFSLRAAWQIRERLRDVETTKLDIADLTDRFTGFQKRDGMRKVRAERTSEADMLAELQTVAQGALPVIPQANDPTKIKQALRRKLRAH